MTLLAIYLACVAGALLISTIALAVRLRKVTEERDDYEMEVIQAINDGKQWEDSSHKKLRLLEVAQERIASQDLELRAVRKSRDRAKALTKTLERTVENLQHDVRVRRIQERSLTEQRDDLKNGYARLENAYNILLAEVKPKKEK